MWRRVLLTVAAMAMLLACTSYDEDVAPPVESIDSGVDSGVDARAVIIDASQTDASTTVDAGVPDAEAVIDAGYNPCDAGFALGEPGAGCELANPFKDPSFQIGVGWTTEKGATILTSTAGLVDLGVARLRKGGVAWGAVKQSITLPPSFADLRLAFTFEGLTMTTTGDFVGRTAVGMTVDGKPMYDYGYAYRPGGTSSLTAEICLGEAVLLGGNSHEIALHSVNAGFDRIDIDTVGLKVTPDCPPRGVVPNGDFETDSGWDYDAEIVIADGFGVGGSRGLHFKAEQGSASEARQIVSVPSVSKVAPALQFHSLGTGVYYVALDGYIINRGEANGTDEQKTVCMPEWSRGIIVDLEIGSGGNAFYAQMGQQFTIDDVKFVDDPKCATSAFLDNRDFENADSLVPGWYRHFGTGYKVERSTSTPHAGTGHLSLTSAPESCISGAGEPAQTHQTVRYPEYDPSETGPRVTFWYRYKPGTKSLARAFDDLDLAPAAAWTKVTRCLDHDPPGTRYEIPFKLSAYNSPCSTSTLDIDDVVFDLDPACKE